jgi:phosphoglycerate dehydrogenase-like enzyme
MPSEDRRRLRVGVAGPFLPGDREAIEAAAPDAEFAFAERTADLAAILPRLDVLATGPAEIPPELVRTGERLKLIHLFSAGVDEALTPELAAHPAVLTCSKGNGAVPLAEHAMMLMLMLNRDATQWIDAQRERRWQPHRHGELNGLTVGLVGLGNSGRDLAAKAKAFHMNVLGVHRSGAGVDDVDEVLPLPRLREMLSRSDFVVVSVPRTPQTIGMFGEAEFRAMKTTAHFICFSRGGIADDAALLRALHEGWIAGAGLDAHSDEPLPPDSPYWTAPRTIVTPHDGANTAATWRRGVDYFVENLIRFRTGGELVNVVDKAAGY